MKIVSVNRSEPQNITINGRDEVTGYFKKPVTDPLYIMPEGVQHDHVADLVHHGGADKACYLYSFDHYPFWKERYPHLEWEFGMFGENLTVENMDESKIHIGDIFRVGTAVIQVSQPRQPCYKMSYKFKDPKMADHFRRESFPGIYVRVLEAGAVSAGDELVALSVNEYSLTVAEVFRLIYDKTPDQSTLDRALDDTLLAESVKKYLRNKFINKS